MYGRNDESHSVSPLGYSRVRVFPAPCAATFGATAPELRCPDLLDAAAGRNRASARGSTGRVCTAAGGRHLHRAGPDDVYRAHAMPIDGHEEWLGLHGGIWSTVPAGPWDAPPSPDP